MFGLIAVVLLTLVGYSSGNVLGARAKRVSPGLLDLLVMVVLWVIALRLHEEVGRWSAVGAGLALGLMIGAVAGAIRPGTSDGREKFAYLEDDAPAPQSGFRAGWNRFAQEMGNFQGRMIMAILYFVVVTPFGLISRIIGDGSEKSSVSPSSFWRERSVIVPELEQARNQF